MTEFHIRSDAVDVEAIMRQIRARIREKRGVDYTEDEIRRLATVKLEKFLEPGSVRSDLLDEFRRRRRAAPLTPPPEPPPLPNYAFEADTIYTSHRAVVRAVRAILRPILKLFFNPGPLIQVLNLQATINQQVAERLATLRNEFWAREQRREEVAALYYEVLHNLVVEMTKLGIELRNLKMRVESLASRLEFDERRARALEGAVAYRPEAVGTPPAPGESPETERRRRRRRRRRRPAAAAPPAPPDGAAAEGAAQGDAAAPERSASGPPEASAPAPAAPAEPPRDDTP